MPRNLGWLGALLATAWAVASLAAPSGANELHPPAVSASTTTVHDEREFQAAVAQLRDSGGTILLAPHAYRELVVPPRAARPLRIVGLPGARVGRIELDRTQRVSLEGLTITPVAGAAWVVVNESSHIDLDRLLVTAAGTAYSASVMLPFSSYITIRRSTFTHCGDRTRAWVNCLRPFWASHVLVSDSWFHDCYGCDFIHGRFKTDLVLRGNRFDRALPCRSAGERCIHQDFIELFAGGGLTVVGNRFGVYKQGGAQLNLPARIDHVRIVNNLFLATDRRIPRYRARAAIVLGYRYVPHNVRIVNNTILSGAERRDGYAGSIRMSLLYGAVPHAQRPILANNVIALIQMRRHVCSELQASVRNVVLHGHACSRSDIVADAALAAGGRPTARSLVLIDRASTRYAPATDIDGNGRVGRPDIGGFEYVPRRSGAAG